VRLGLADKGFEDVQLCLADVSAFRDYGRGEDTHCVPRVDMAGGKGSGPRNTPYLFA
jgi:hypothetical protein